jgi:hypothetical protein
MRLQLAIGLLLLAPAAAPAQTMNAEGFHQRAAALQAKGVMALFSGGEIKALTAEGQAAGARAAAARKAAIAAGKKPRFCPPPGPAKMGNNEFMQRLSAIPAADRAQIDMTEAMTRILAAKYPCR